MAEVACFVLGSWPDDCVGGLLERKPRRRRCLWTSHSLALRRKLSPSRTCDRGVPDVTTFLLATTSPFGVDFAPRHDGIRHAGGGAVMQREVGAATLGNVA